MMLGFESRSLVVIQFRISSLTTAFRLEFKTDSIVALEACYGVKELEHDSMTSLVTKACRDGFASSALGIGHCADSVFRYLFDIHASSALLLGSTP